MTTVYADAYGFNASDATAALQAALDSVRASADVDASPSGSDKAAAWGKLKAELSGLNWTIKGKADIAAPARSPTTSLKRVMLSYNWASQAVAVALYEAMRGTANLDVWMDVHNMHGDSSGVRGAAWLWPVGSKA